MDHKPPPKTRDGTNSTSLDLIRLRLTALRTGRVRRKRSIGELLQIDREVIVQTVKVAVSAGLSWALAVWWLDSPAPIWAPITASLIALLTVQASIRDAAEKVFAVTLGILVAIWLGGLIGLHSWSIALIVGIGFLAGKVLRLGPGAAAQIPINGMFVLALGSSQVPQRFLDTLIGATVAVLVNFVIVPPNHVAAATRSVATLADDVVDAMGTVAVGISQPWPSARAADWLLAARALGRSSAAAEAEVRKADQSQSLHPTRSSWAASLVRLRQANETLQVIELQNRTIARTIRDVSVKFPDRDGRQLPMPMAVGDAAGHRRRDRGVRAHGAAGAAGWVAGRDRRAGPSDDRHRPGPDQGDQLRPGGHAGRQPEPRGVPGRAGVETGRMLDELDAGLAALDGD